MTNQPATNTPLQQLIHERIVATGGLPFVEFMSLCLYHSEYGYYMTDRQRIGKGGDFFTSSSVHALFGALIARQLRQMWELLDKPAEFVIAEQGAGEGHLCLDILEGAQQESPEFYRAIRYHLVEISPDNRTRQQQLLQRHAARLTWSAVESLHGMVGCWLSNELPDAFPVHLVQMHAGVLHEVYVVVVDGTLQEELRPVVSDELRTHLDWLGITPVEGQRLEINRAAVHWIQQVAQLLERGFVLTIDYGYPAAELYAPWRTTGTLLCYQKHTSNEQPLERVGEQDITTHVDFTALSKAGAAAGLVELYFGEQYRFLLGLGFVDAVISAEAQEVDPRRAQGLRMTLKNLIMPDGGMGETFKVLIQGKNVGTPELLCARAVRDLPFPVGFRP